MNGNELLTGSLGRCMGKDAFWKCFKVEHEGSATAICNVCKIGISYRGKKMPLMCCSIIKLQPAYFGPSLHMELWHSYVCYFSDPSSSTGFKYFVHKF